MTVAFDGTETGKAAVHAFAPDAERVMQPRGARIVEAVATGEVERGVAAVEDASGSRTDLLDALLDTDAVRVVGERWEEADDGATRFVLLAPLGTAPDRAPTKTTLALTPKTEVPNALFRSLTAFVGRRLTIFKVEPFPRTGQPGAYRYVIDVEGDAEAEPLASALADLAALNDAVQVLGSYPAAALQTG